MTTSFNLRKTFTSGLDVSERPLNPLCPMLNKRKNVGKSMCVMSSGCVISDIMEINHNNKTTNITNN